MWRREVFVAGDGQEGWPRGMAIQVGLFIPFCAGCVGISIGVGHVVFLICCLGTMATGVNRRVCGVGVHHFTFTIFV